MHDANGKPLSVGDKVTISATITQLGAEEGFCNVSLETTLGRRPDGNKETISGINTAVLELDQSDESPACECASAAAEEYSSILILEVQPRDSTVIFHPPGTYQYLDENGTVSETPYRDMARQAGEQAKAGSVLGLPKIFDEKGESLWDVKKYQNQDDPEQQKHVAEFMKRALAGTGIKCVVLPPGTTVAATAGIDTVEVEDEAE